MTFTNVFLGIAIFLNSISFISSSKACKNQSSVEKSDIMVLNYNEDLFDLYESSPKYFLDSLVYELTMRKIHKPYLHLIIDDINATAGIETRLESFLDILVQY